MLEFRQHTTAVEVLETLVAPEQHAAALRPDVGAAYDAHRHLLMGTAIGRYRIAESDAESLVHDVFLAYIGNMEDVRDARAWLLTSIHNASKQYLRTRGRDVELNDDVAGPPEAPTAGSFDGLPGDVAVRDCFACITPRCQLALRLRYLEGYSIGEIAAELNTTDNYAKKLVSKCLQQAQHRYAKGVV